jgi:hypothetical protein
VIKNHEVLMDKGMLFWRKILCLNSQEAFYKLLSLIKINQTLRISLRSLNLLYSLFNLSMPITSAMQGIFNSAISCLKLLSGSLTITQTLELKFSE